MEGVTVLDLTQAYAGPYATLIFRFLGARVIKVEKPNGGDMTRTNPPYYNGSTSSIVARSSEDVSLPFVNRSRGKESIVLDLRDPHDRETVTHLVERSDVLIENFSAGALARLGLGPQWARTINPRLVYCSISGFGDDGEAESGGQVMDMMIQALSGLMDVTGEADGPPMRVGIPIGDLLAPLFGCIGVLAALRRREATGRGDHVDISMLDCLTSFVAGEHFDVLAACGVPSRTGNFLARMTPFGAFATQDGQVAICAPTDPFAFRLFEAMGMAGLASDPRFLTREKRVAHQDELNEIVLHWTRSQTTGAVLATLEGCQVPAAPVRSVGEALRDPRVAQRQAVVSFGAGDPTCGDDSGPYGSGIPIRFSDSSVGLPDWAPGLNEFGAVIRSELEGLTGPES